MSREIQERTFRLALRVTTLATSEYQRVVRQVVVRQMVRAVTSVGANVEEAAAAQTKPDFVAKMSVARKEAREANFWLRLAHESGVAPGVDWHNFRREAMEVSRVVAAITRNAQRSANRQHKT
jgi:four helix bundle protein